MITLSLQPSAAEQQVLFDHPKRALAGVANTMTAPRQDRVSFDRRASKLHRPANFRATFRQHIEDQQFHDSTTGWRGT
ncbi:MAG: hypothetical protein C5B57_02325 [Blastocatellia bacterium]|nr:MAG: hypothetical protein C5B57_02325 [Blastocatellia bacterium]